MKTRTGHYLFALAMFYQVNASKDDKRKLFDQEKAHSLRRELFLTEDIEYKTVNLATLPIVKTRSQRALKKSGKDSKLEASVFVSSETSISVSTSLTCPVDAELEALCNGTYEISVGVDATTTTNIVGIFGNSGKFGKESKGDSVIGSQVTAGESALKGPKGSSKGTSVTSADVSTISKSVKVGSKTSITISSDSINTSATPKVSKGSSKDSSVISSEVEKTTSKESNVVSSDVGNVIASDIGNVSPTSTVGHNSRRRHLTSSSKDNSVSASDVGNVGVAPKGGKSSLKGSSVTAADLSDGSTTTKVGKESPKTKSVFESDVVTASKGDKKSSNKKTSVLQTVACPDGAVVSSAVGSKGKGSGSKKRTRRLRHLKGKDSSKGGVSALSLDCADNVTESSLTELKLKCCSIVPDFTSFPSSEFVQQAPQPPQVSAPSIAPSADPYCDNTVSSPTTKTCGDAYVYCPGRSMCFLDAAFNGGSEATGWGFNVIYDSTKQQTVDDCQVWMGVKGCDLSTGKQVGTATITKDLVHICLDLGEYESNAYQLYAGKCVTSDGGLQLTNGGVCDNAAISANANQIATFPIVQLNGVPSSTFSFDSNSPINTNVWPSYSVFPIGVDERNYIVAHVEVCPIDNTSITTTAPSSGFAQEATAPPTTEAPLSVAPLSKPTLAPVTLPIAPVSKPTLLPISQPTSAPLPLPIIVPTASPVYRPTATPISPPKAAPIAPPSAAPIASPTAAPIKTPTTAPLSPPSAAPISPPTAAPIKLPTAAPISPPTVAPIIPPTAAPITSPTAAPITAPTAAPITPPTAAPITPPTAAPITPPTAAPIPPPTVAPILPPTVAPILPPTVAPILPPITPPLSPPTMAPVNKPTVQPTNKPVLLTFAPVTAFPVTSKPITIAPSVAADEPLIDVTASPITATPITASPISSSPISAAPITLNPIIAAPVTAAPLPLSPTSLAPIATSAPISTSPVTTAPNECETAYAYCPGRSTCLSAVYNSSSAFGWSITYNSSEGTIEDCDIYIGVKPGCDMSNATKVGTFTITPILVHYCLKLDNYESRNFHFYSGKCPANDNAVHITEGVLQCSTEAMQLYGNNYNTFPLVSDANQTYVDTFTFDGADKASGNWTSNYKVFNIGTEFRRYMTAHASVCTVNTVPTPPFQDEGGPTPLTIAPVPTLPQVTSPIAPAPVAVPVVPITLAPVPVVPITLAPLPVVPITLAPLPVAPITAVPVPVAPITAVPVPVAPITAVPVPVAPITAAPVPVAPITAAPVPIAPITAAPVPVAPITAVPVPVAPITAAPVPIAPITAAPVPVAPITAAPVPVAPITAAPVPVAPITAAPVPAPQSAAPVITPTKTTVTSTLEPSLTQDVVSSSPNISPPTTNGTVCMNAFAMCRGQANSTCFTELHQEEKLYGWTILYNETYGTVDQCTLYAGEAKYGCDLSKSIMVGTLTIKPTEVTYNLIPGVYESNSFHLYVGKCRGNDKGDNLKNGGFCNVQNICNFADVYETYPLVSDNGPKVNTFTFNSSSPVSEPWQSNYTIFPVGTPYRHFITAHATVCAVDGTFPLR